MEIPWRNIFVISVLVALCPYGYTFKEHIFAGSLIFVVQLIAHLLSNVLH